MFCSEGPYLNSNQPCHSLINLWWVSYKTLVSVSEVPRSWFGPGRRECRLREPPAPGPARARARPPAPGSRCSRGPGNGAGGARLQPEPLQDGTGLPEAPGAGAGRAGPAVSSERGRGRARRWEQSPAGAARGERSGAVREGRAWGRPGHGWG